MQETIETKQQIAESRRSFRPNRGWPKSLMIIIALAAGAISVVPYFFSHYQDVRGEREYKFIVAHDLGNHYFVMGQFEHSFHLGVLYPRWFAEANKGYGIATPNFYPPGFYYITTFTNAIFGNWHTTLFVIMALAFAGSGLALYSLARIFFGRLPSAIAAFVYMLLPYHLLDLYFRGAFPELIGFINLPLILYFAYKVGTEGRWRHYAGLAFFFGLHWLTHLPVALLFSYTMAFYAVVWAARERDLKIAVRIGIGLALGLVVSAVYWLPAAVEAKYAFEYATSLYPYHSMYINPTPTDDLFGQIIQNSFRLTVLFVLAALAVLRLAPQGINERGVVEPWWSQARIWLIMCAATVFMTTFYSYDIGKLLPKIEVAVPPFRWLSISSVFMSLLVAACFECLRKIEGLAQWKLWLYRGVTAGIIVFSLWLSVSKVIPGAVKNPAFQPIVNYVEQGLIPRGATVPDKLPDTPAVTIEPENGYSEIIRWQPQSREVRVKADSPVKVRLKTYNFPGWTARIDGQKTPLSSDQDGVMLIDVPQGLHTIQVDLENTPPRTIGALLSGIGFISVFGLTLADYALRRKRRGELHPADVNATAKYGEGSRPNVEAKTIKSKFAAKKTIVIAVALAITAAIIVVIISSRSNRKSAGDPTAGAGARRSTLSVGSEAHLYVEGLNTIPVAADEKTLDELVGALAAKDENKINALTDSGSVTNVASDTRVQIIERGAGKMKVRIAEGQQLAKEGWIGERWIR